MKFCRRENHCCCPPERPAPTPGCSGCLVAALLIGLGFLLLCCLLTVFP